MVAAELGEGNIVVGCVGVGNLKRKERKNEI